MIVASLNPYSGLLLAILAWVVHMSVSMLAVPSVLRRRRGRPFAAISWLASILFLPGIGLLMWWALGRNRMRRRLRRHARRRESAAGTTGFDAIGDAGDPDGLDASHLKELVPHPPLGDYAYLGHARNLQLLSSGEGAFSALRTEIEGARQSIEMFFFLFELDETGKGICELLAQQAERGLVVRLLLDSFGSSETYGEIRELLEPRGVQVAEFMAERWRPVSSPRWNFANHRKMTVCDAKVGFLGGMNIGDDYQYHWTDLMIRFEGSAVRRLRELFCEDWYFATDELFTPSGPRDEPKGGSPVALVASGPDTEAWIHDLFIASIHSARSRLILTTPYFIPTQTLLCALRIASHRGVEVDLVLPAESDVLIATWAARSFYPELLRAGVRVWEYQPRMLHAKSMIFDDRCLIGSANLDHRSLLLNFEICGVFESASLTNDLVKWAEQLQEQSHLVELEDFERRPRARALGESLAHLLTPVL